MTTDQVVSFRNARGQRLVGTFHGTVAADIPVVLCCHGMLSDRHGNKTTALAEALAARGLAALRFDFAGRGESEGRLYDMSYSAQVEDVLAAVEYLVSRGCGPLGLYGSSMGGAVALLAAAREPRVQALVTLAAVGHPELTEERLGLDATRQWRQEGMRTDEGVIGPGYLDDAAQRDVLAAAAVIRAPALVFHGTEDTLVPPSDAQDIACALADVRLELVMGADHRFSNPSHLRPMLRQSVDFLVASLQPLAGGADSRLQGAAAKQ